MVLFSAGKVLMHRINKSKEIVLKLLDMANIQVNGKSPWDIHVHDEQFYERVLKNADLGLGESYMEGWWDCERLDLFFERIIRADIASKIKLQPKLAFRLLLSKILNFQTKKRGLQVGRKHYDRGNDLFEAMLDSKMTYTCGYWKNAHSLEQAQTAKLDLACQKLFLKPGLTLLDIGCGWGGLAEHAARHYEVNVLGITISQRQCELARERCKGLPVKIHFQDYRDVTGQFDRVASLGMFEHVGYFNYHRYMRVVSRCLKEDGLFLLHTIGGNESTTQTIPWISKYIFPNGMIPSIAQIGQASEQLLIMEDWQNFGPDYYQTLLSWHENFNKNWHRLKHKYDETFFRMWNYYLLSCAGGFKSRMLQLWQIVFSKGLEQRYDAPR
ncbi:cyclopropane fatty acyl phospholipid synthase [Legionella jordanis]|nr:cyclopropane fatty acyl phospholipid synthase [Legionella jordanis]RMX18686.1 cyclopropane fatty acyl phospholipid synthase [Legionella jordanis]